MPVRGVFISMCTSGKTGVRADVNEAPSLASAELADLNRASKLSRSSFVQQHLL
jgi:hypothetical protein